MSHSVMLEEHCNPYSAGTLPQTALGRWRSSGHSHRPSSRLGNGQRSRSQRKVRYQR